VPRHSKHVIKGETKWDITGKSLTWSNVVWKYLAKPKENDQGNVKIGRHRTEDNIGITMMAHDMVFILPYVGETPFTQRNSCYLEHWYRTLKQRTKVFHRVFLRRNRVQKIYSKQANTYLWACWALAPFILRTYTLMQRTWNRIIKSLNIIYRTVEAVTGIAITETTFFIMYELKLTVSLYYLNNFI